MVISEQEIRNEWFKNHKATYTKVNDTISILDWRKPGTIYYYVRYVFDSSHVYITGDLGEAVLNLTWFATLQSFKNVSIDYLHEKLAAYHTEKKVYDRETAIENIKYWLIEYREYEAEDEEIERNKKLAEELISVADDCSSTSEWAFRVNQDYDDRLSEVDCDFWEWAYSIGEVIPSRFIAYLVGLQMANEQLNEQN